MAACNDYTNVSGCEHGDYTGNPLPSAITVNADSVLVVFTSTANSETDYGFVLKYEATSFNKSACTDKTYTDQCNILTDKPNNAMDDDTYRASNVCEYTLNLKYTGRIVYTFPKFDLKDGDFVDIYYNRTQSANSRELIERYDINTPPTQVYSVDVPTFNVAGAPTARILVRFASDNKIQGNGFAFEYYGIHTGINDFNDVEVSMYPNPATNYVNVEVTAEEAQEFNASVVDMMGKTVYSDQFSHNGGTELFVIPVNNLAKGVYFLHLNSGNGSHVQKFVVE